jgi:hypothetical protein
MTHPPSCPRSGACRPTSATARYVSATRIPTCPSAAPRPARPPAAYPTSPRRARRLSFPRHCWLAPTVAAHTTDGPGANCGDGRLRHDMYGPDCPTPRYEENREIDRGLRRTGRYDVIVLSLQRQSIDWCLQGAGGASVQARRPEEWFSELGDRGEHIDR